MKKLVAVCAVVSLVGALVWPVIVQAQQPGTKGTEGPDARKQEQKGTEGPDVRKSEKKP